MSAVIKLSLPIGLLAVYLVGALIWYELLRAELVYLLGRRRCGRGHPGQEAADGVAGDEARMHYYLGRKAAAAERDAAVEAAKEATRQAVERIERRYGRAGSATDGHTAGKAAKAERDAAVAAAKEASKQAIERIERRYREIDWALEDEEDERIRAMLERVER